MVPTTMPIRKGGSVSRNFQLYCLEIIPSFRTCADECVAEAVRIALNVEIGDIAECRAIKRTDDRASTPVRCNAQERYVTRSAGGDGPNPWIREVTTRLLLKPIRVVRRFSINVVSAAPLIRTFELWST